MQKEYNEGMPELTIFLVISSWPGPYAAFFEDLECLRARYTIELTLLDNGVGLSPAWIKKIAPTHRKSVPLRLWPAQSLNIFLEKPLNAPIGLWWPAETRLPLEALENWIPALEDWTAIHPRSSKFPQTQQAEAQGITELAPSQTQVFPDCLMFKSENREILKLWCAPEAQMPLMLLGCDIKNPSENSEVFPPLSFEPALTASEGLERYALLNKEKISPLRRKTLLESLQKAFPNGLRLLKELLPLLPLSEALPLLHQALLQKNFHPDLLAWSSQALLAAGQTGPAIQTKNGLDTLCPGFRLSPSPWAQTEIQTEHVGIQPAKLAIFISWTGSQSDLDRSMQSLQTLAAESVLVLPPEPPTMPAQAKQPPTYQSFYLSENPPSPESLLKLLNTTEADWILLLEAGEELEPEALKTLRKWLWHPPAGANWALKACIQEADAQGKPQAIHQALRLFPRHQVSPFNPCFPFNLNPLSLRVFTQAFLPLKRLSTPRETPLTQAMEAVGTEAWHTVLNLLKPHLKNCPATLYPQVMLLWVHALLKTNQNERLLELWPELHEKLHAYPDYWYLKGAWLRRQNKQQEAHLALERCLNFRPQELQALEWYSPDSLNRWPLKELLALHWNALFQGPAEIGIRQGHLRELRRILHQLFSYYPEGQLSPEHWSLFEYLALTAILTSHYQPGQTARDLFLQNLPQGHEKTLSIYYLETALLYLEGQFRVLPDRLPPGYSTYESMRDLQQNPSYLLPFSETLWQATEMDGPEIATAFLLCSALHFRDISYLLWLARLQQASGQNAKALFTLQACATVFPGHALLPTHPEQFLDSSQASELAAFQAPC